MSIYWLGIGLGLFLIAVGVLNWESFFFDSESRLMELLGGETLVRWYWGLIGLGVIVVTILYWTGLV